MKHEMINHFTDIKGLAGAAVMRKWSSILPGWTRVWRRLRCLSGQGTLFQERSNHE
ncbi:hypothetical protein V1224_12370 [Lachnospiraceae bacterium JLR.KK008]